jgi:trk system potassium uptake protein TrkH
MAFLRRVQKWHPAVQVISGFLGLIALGTVLLLLPISTPAGKDLSFTDAVFTATSAVCVTGLIVVQTPVHFTFFGELVTLFLFQVGGIGIIFGSTMLILGVRGTLGIEQRFSVQESFLNWPFDEIRRVLFLIFKLFFTVELIGAGVLTALFAREKPFLEALWHGVYHSVSAVCNAGFSLNTDSLMSYQHDPLVVLTVAVLIVFGGIGFVVLAELIGRGKQRYRYSLHTRTMLIGTCSFIIAGMGLFYLLQPGATWLDALFQSVTTRTAGFNSANISQWATPTTVIMMFLMFVGAGPASTAGGIKITTFFAALADVYSRLKPQTGVHWLDRRLPEEMVNDAVVLFASAAFIVGSTIFLLTITESASLEVIAFEAFSALGTVGLSLGLTPELSEVGRWIIICAMFLGRLGPLTFVVLLVETSEPEYRYPEEQLLIG